MTTKTLFIKGTITTQTPLSYAPPFGDENFKTGAIELPRLNGFLYLTASGIRSAIRHAATHAVIECLSAKPSLDDYFLMALGGIKNANDNAGKGDDADEADGNERAEQTKEADGGKSAGAIVRNRYARAHNPMATLFGTMSHDVAGALYCAHAIAVDDAIQPDLVRYVRADDFRRTPEVADSLNESAVSDFVARQSRAADRSALSREITALKAALKKAKSDPEKSAELGNKIKEVQASLDASSVIQLSLPNLAYYVIPQGVVFSHEFILNNVSDMEIALFLEGLSRFATNPYLGGKQNHGLGRVKASWSVRGRESGERVMRDMGRIEIDGEFNPAVITGDIAGLANFDLIREGIQNGQLDFSEVGLSTATLTKAA